MKSKSIKILSCERANQILRKQISFDVEELWCLALGPTLNLIDLKMIFRGTVDSCIAHPRDIFRFGCIKNATQILIAHSHPSGDATPSIQDIEQTRNLIRVGNFIDIPLVDHLIMTKYGYYSIAESGILNF